MKEKKNPQWIRIKNSRFNLKEMDSYKIFSREDGNKAFIEITTNGKAKEIEFSDLKNKEEVKLFRKSYKFLDKHFQLNDLNSEDNDYF
jgi:hypothetical protein